MSIEPMGLTDADFKARLANATGLQAAASFIRQLTIARPKPDPAKMPSWFATVPNTIGNLPSGKPRLTVVAKGPRISPTQPADLNYPKMKH